ncbi:Hypothetical protein FKW44_004013, partial [Caligus rogercresseyi]
KSNSGKVSFFEVSSVMEKIIFNSTCGIPAGSQFTAQFQISADLIQFYILAIMPIFIQNTLHAFVDCPY